MTENTNFLQDQAEIVEKLGEIDQLLQLFEDKYGVTPIIENARKDRSDGDEWSGAELRLVISKYER